MNAREATANKRTLGAIWRTVVVSDVGILLLLAAAVFVLHMVLNGQYGFHRDELGLIADGNYLDWGYVSYPPLAPFLARMAMELFGPALVGLRLPAALGQAAAIVLVGLMVRDLGGGRRAQILAALAAGISLTALVLGSVLQYVSLDYVWWVLIAYLMARLLRTDDPRWWLGIGAAVGLGLMTKYTLAFYLAGLVVGVLLGKARRHLRSPWLWAGAGLALLIVLPNLIWQVRHGLVSLDFLRTIHTRDVAIGRTDSFLVEQLILGVNPFMIPLWIAGLCFLAISKQGKPFRALFWMYAVPLLLFYVAQGRSYYIAPAYPMLVAGGAVAWERWQSKLSRWPARASIAVTCALVVVGSVFAGALGLPIAPVNSEVWKVSAEVHDIFREQIGWPELVETVAGIYHALPAEERAHTAILVGNYGEMGALMLYGPAYGLPQPISGVNSHWYRGYGVEPPQTVISLGVTEHHFNARTVAGRISNRYGVPNEESEDSPTIFICREPRLPWPELWAALREFS